MDWGQHLQCYSMMTERWTSRLGMEEIDDLSSLGDRLANINDTGDE